MRRLRHWSLAVLMLVLGILLVKDVFRGFRNWEAYGPALQAVYILFLVAGVVLVTSGLSILFLSNLRLTAMWSASGAFLLFGVTQTGGILSNIIPCGGPS